MRQICLFLLSSVILLGQPDALRTRSTGQRDHVLNLVPHVSRTAPVEINLSVLKTGSRIPFQLFDKTRAGAVVTKVLTGDAGSTVWQGVLEGDEYSEFIISKYGDAVSGHIRLGNGTYYELITLDGEMFLRELLPGVESRGDAIVAPSTEGAPPIANAATEDGSVIDILVAYTQQLRVIRGGQDQVEALIREGVAQTNAAFERSGVQTRLRLVKTAEVRYLETGNTGTDLQRLRAASDGHMDEIHALRHQFGADLVSLWITLPGQDAAGRAYLYFPPAQADLSIGFSIVAAEYAVGNLTFAHELGHNLGGHHDPANADGRPFVDYAYGYQYLGGADSFRTIMAYECTGAVRCPRVSYFSSPRIQVGNRPAGFASNDNARAFNESRGPISRYVAAVDNPAQTTTVTPSTLTVPSAGASITLNITADGDWRSYSPYSTVTIRPASGTGNGQVVVTFPPSQSVSPLSGTVFVGTSAVSFRQAGNSALACPVEPLEFDVVTQTNLVTCQGSSSANFTFDGVAGQPISLEVASSDVDVVAALDGPTGWRGGISQTSTIDISDDHNGTSNARIPFSDFVSLPVTGRYRVRVWDAGSPNAPTTGSSRFTISLRNNPEHCRFSLPRELRFAPGRGIVNLNIGTANGCGWSLTPSSDWIALELPSQRQGAGTATVSVLSNPESQERVAQLTLTSSLLRTPQVVSIVQSGATPCNVQDLTLDEKVESAIGAGACPSLTRGDTFPAQRFRFQGRAGQRVTLSARSSQFEPLVQLFHAAGTLVRSGDRGVLGTEANAVRLPHDGFYLAEISGFDPGSIGAFTLETKSATLPAAAIPAAALPLETPLTLELPSVTEATLFTDRLLELEVPANAIGLEVNAAFAPTGSVVNLHLRAEEPPVFTEGQVLADASGTSAGEGRVSIALDASSTPALRAGRYYLAVSQGSLASAASVTVTARVRTAAATDFRLADQWMTATPPASGCALPSKRADAFLTTDPQAAFVFTGLAQQGGVAQIEFIDPSGVVRLTQTLPAQPQSATACGLAVMPIAGSANAALVGRWRVRFTWDGVEIFSRGFVLSASPAPLPPALTLGTPLPLSLNAAPVPLLLNGSQVYRVLAPAGASRLVIRLATQTPRADLDLYVRADAVPASNGSRIIADFASEGTGDEVITIDRTLSFPRLEDGTTYFVTLAQRTAGVAIQATLTATAITDPFTITSAVMMPNRGGCETGPGGEVLDLSSGFTGRMGMHVRGTGRAGTRLAVDFRSPRGTSYLRTIPTHTFDGSFCLLASLVFDEVAQADRLGSWQATLRVNDQDVLVRSFVVQAGPPATIDFPSEGGVGYAFTRTTAGLYPTQFRLKVPAGMRQVVLTMRSKSGPVSQRLNLDLLVQSGSRVQNAFTASFSAISPSPNETLTINNPAPGDYYVAISGPGVSQASVSIIPTLTSVTPASSDRRALSPEVMQETLPNSISTRR